MRRPLLTLGALLSAGIISLGAGGATIAQDEVTTSGGGMSGPHPAHIHSGSCGDGLGEVVIPLSDVTAMSQAIGTPMAASPVASPMAGGMSAIPVMASITIVDTAMADILAGEHAINVHESADAMGNYIACGSVNAMMWDETSVLFGIAPQNDSGVSGIGSLYDNGDGTTTVFIYLTMSALDGGGMATPMASPVS